MCYQMTIFLCLDELSYSFLSLVQLQHFALCTFNIVKYLLRVLLMQSFLLASLLLVHLHPFLTFCIYVDKFILFSLFTFMLISSPSWSSSGCVSRISLHLESLEWQQSTLSLSAISLITLFMFDWNFTSKIITFCFFGTLSSLLAISLFCLFIFVKCHIHLSPGDKEATQLHNLLSVHDLNNRVQ